MYTEEEQSFIDFLGSYSRFYLPSREIAENKFGETILPAGQGDFRMYALDEICHSCKIFREGKFLFTPKTTDAIWYKKVNGMFYIFLIEFKGDFLFRNSSKCSLIELADNLKAKNEHLNDELKSELKTANWLIGRYSDRMLNGLAAKPLETVTVALPLIYEDYLGNNPDVQDINIRSFLDSSRIIYRVISLARDWESNRLRARSKSFRSSNVIPSSCKKYAELKHDREPVTSYESSLKTHHRRYERAGIVYSADFVDNTAFNNFIDNYLR